MPITSPSAPSARISGAALVDLLGPWSTRDGPLYRVLADRISRLADTGALPPGARLPPERDLAIAASVSRTTTAAAYQLLRDHGLAETRQGSGTTITPHRTTPAAVHRANGFFAGLLAASVIDVDLTIAAPDCPPCVASAIDDPRSVLDAGTRRAVTAGSGYHLHGFPAMRAALAEHVTTHLAIDSRPEQIIVTTGAQQAIDLLMRSQVLPGQPVIVEDPTFPGAIDALHRAGARPIGFDTGHGIDPQRLAAAVATHRPAVVLLVLTHNNPQGQVVDERVRPAIARLAANNPDTVFVDDLTLAELAFEPGPGGRPPRPLAAYAPDCPNIVTVGSFSKTYWGGLRVGWIRAVSGLVGGLASTKATADLGTPALTQAITTALLTTRHEEIVRWRAGWLRERGPALQDALRHHLPTWSWTPPRGGLSLWAHLTEAPGRPASADAGTFVQLALRRGIAVVPGRLFSVADHHPGAVRIAYTAPPEQLHRAVLGLAEAWHDLVAR